MPLVFRSMIPTEAGPRLGRDAKSLGVRVPQDVALDVEGHIYPGTGGMSVAPSINDLPGHRIPVRLRPLIPKARGSDDVVVWKYGEGDWTDGSLSASLALRIDGSVHGLIEPFRRMPLDQYEAALNSTQPRWINAEEQGG